MRRSIKLCLALLLLTITSDAQDVRLNNPFTSFSAPPISDAKVSSRVVANITNGDFVQPAFSPDGKFLAYSKVLLKDQFENTEVWLHNLSTNKQAVLLNSRKAAKYATYKAAVTEMKWRSAKRLEVLVSDGDVGLTLLTFDPHNRRLLKERVDDLDEMVTQPMSPVDEKAYQKARSLFPSFPPNVLDHALRDTALVIPDRGIILQTNYSGHDDNVWFLDFENKSVRALMNLPQGFAGAFNGAVVFKSAIVLVLSHGPTTYLFLYRDGKITGLAEFKSSGYSRIEVKHVSPSKTIFLLKAHAPYERGDNPLYVFDGRELLRIKEYPELYDAEVDPAGQRIAYCYWAGDKRHIAVRELN